jgi:hypothetical protein
MVQLRLGDEKRPAAGSAAVRLRRRSSQAGDDEGIIDWIEAKAHEGEEITECSLTFADCAGLRVWFLHISDVQ